MNPSSESVDQLLSRLSPLARHFGYMMEKLAGADLPTLRLAAALTSHFTTEHGNVCVDLHTIGRQLSEIDDTFILPPAQTWAETLRKTGVVGAPGDFRPLIIDNKNRLFLHRFWCYEEKLARLIRSRSRGFEAATEKLKAIISGVFASTANRTTRSVVDWQKVAAVAAATRHFSVITGGPGTGKTTTIVRTLAVLVSEAVPKQLRIALAAPTGKAAARLEEAVAQTKHSLCLPAAIKEALPSTATTIHRLLGITINAAQPIYSAENPLPLDVIVVDEASMIDLSMMLKLFEATSATSRIILAGDKDQLGSVDTGAVLSEICTGTVNRFSPEFCKGYLAITGELLEPTAVTSPLNDTVVELQNNFRFESVEISALASAVNNGNGTLAQQVIEQNPGVISWRPLPKGADFETELAAILQENWRDYFTNNEIPQTLQLFNRFRILTPLRYGHLGVHWLNERVEQSLAEAHFIRKKAKWYDHRPIMITQNDYNLRLFNGDVGIVDEVQRAKFRVMFTQADGATKSFVPSRLPAHETVYATTIHKSQGSEFDHLLLVMPNHGKNVVNRQMLYTAITRAKKKLTIWSTAQTLADAIGSNPRRDSSLHEGLHTPSLNL